VITTGLFSGFHLPRWARSLAIGAAVAIAGLVLISIPLGRTFERTFGLDWLFKIRGAVSPPAEVVVVGINSRTGRALDLPRLPRDWPRTVHARLLTRLIEQNAEAVVFDFDFSRAKLNDEDAVFANTIAQAKRVVLYEWLAGRRERVANAAGGDAGWTWVEEKTPPIGMLAKAARALGPFPLPKLDQAVFEFWTFKPSVGDAPTTAAIALQLQGLLAYDRWLAALKEAQAPGIDVLPRSAEEITDPEQLRQVMLRLRRTFQDDPGLGLRVEGILERADANQPDLPTRRLLSALAALYSGPDHQYINFYGPAGTIRTIPYETVLADDAAKQIGDLSGHVVFVGYSDLYDPDQPDRFYTSFTSSDGIDLSGVEIMATAYANLLTQRPVQTGDPMTEEIFVVCFGLAVGFMAYLLPAMVGVPLVFAFAAFYGMFAQWRFNGAELWLPLAIPMLVQLPLALLLGLMGQYLLERRKEQQMARAISYYLPENIVRDLTEKQIDPDSVNKVVFATCLATDMAGFTTLSETMSPKELATFMNAYFDALAQVLKRHAVDVTEFHADTIMCAWTAPERSPAICRKAVDAAIEVTRTIEKFGLEHGSIKLNPRIGLQDGNIYLGHTGGGGRMAYSILGDTANTAARLESLNKHLGTHILAAESVAGNAADLLLRPLGRMRLAGKAEPVSVVEILGKRSEATAGQLALCEEFARAVAVFQNRQWDQAAVAFEELVARFGNDGPCHFYLARSRKYALEAPAETDPTVIHMDQK
jgi:adenylate cyclase